MLREQFVLLHCTDTLLGYAERLAATPLTASEQTDFLALILVRRSSPQPAVGPPVSSLRGVCLADGKRGFVCGRSTPAGWLEKAAAGCAQSKEGFAFAGVCTF